MTQLDKSAIQSRNTLLAMFVALSILDAALIIISQDRWAIGRILLTIAVMYFALQGRKWAKWVLMGICSLVVVLLMAMLIALSYKLSTTLIVGSLIMVILCIIIPIYMVSSKDLNRYFLYKRQNYSQT